MARNGKVLAMLAGVVITITVLAGVADAAAPPWMFATREECDTAISAGEKSYRIYVPKDTRNKGKNPVDGVTKVVAPLETVIGVACVEMDTQMGRKFVPQAEGTKLRWKINADGPPTPYALDICGNNIYSISYGTLKLPEEEEKAEAETPVSDLGPQVGDPCTSIDEASGEPFTGRVSAVDSYGSAFCDAVVEVEVESPWLKPLQYGACIVAGGAVGFYRSGVPGLITGAVAGAGGTYLGRELGGENWGWIGCATGTAAGLIKWGDGGSSLLKGAPVNPPLAGGPVSPPLGFVW